MEERRLDLRKNVFNKTQYIKTIDTDFNELGVTSGVETLVCSVIVDLNSSRKSSLRDLISLRKA